MNAAIMALLVEKLGVAYLAGQVVATVAVLLWGFVANRYWTFGDAE